MDPERSLTVGVVAFFAGSMTLFLVLTVVGSLTDGADALRFGAAGVSGLLVTLVVGYLVHTRASTEQLTGR